MKEEIDFSKFGRYLIPGWIFLSSFAVYYLMDMYISRELPRYFSLNLNIINTLNNKGLLTDNLFTTLIVAIAGIPIGFLVYQLYFYSRWNTPYARFGLSQLFNTGREFDVRDMIEGIPPDKLTKNRIWRKKLFHNHEVLEFRHKWRYVEWLFTQLVQVLDKSTNVSFFDRSRYLNTVVHTLGASIVANFIGFIAYFVLKLFEQHDYISLIGWHFIYIFLTTFLLFYFLNKEGSKHYEQDKNDGAWVSTCVYDNFDRLDTSIMLFFFLFLIQLFNNPLFIPSGNPLSHIVDLLLRLFSVFLVYGLYATIRKTTDNDDFKDCLKKKFYFLISIIFPMIVFRILTYRGIINLDWPFLLSTFLFLFISYLLFLNRENANDDINSLVNYVLKNKLLK